MSNIELLERKALLAFKPPKKLTLSEWADENAFLSAESSAEGGRWRTLPYQKGMMDAITDPAVEQVTVMKSARVGYSKILNHVIGYHIHQDPAPIMLVQPTIEDAQGYSKEEIAPMLRDTPVLKGLVSEAKAKDGANTILQKQFPGGTLSLVGANSPRGFRRVSRRIVLFDEVDGYPPSAGSEGDQIKLGIRRTEYYWNRKIVSGSTPTVKDFSRIQRMYEQSNAQRFFVPCPHCNHMQYLRWAQIKWFDDDASTACYECEKCNEHIPHAKKRWMVERGEWRETKPGNGKHVGFHIWAAYSYSPNAAWSNLVEEFLEAKHDAEQLKTFVNTILGEVWEDEYASKVSGDSLMQRAAEEKYKQGSPPAEVLLLTCGCDCQDDRLSMSVWGVARDEEMYLVDRIVLHGSPSRPEVWKQLDEVLQKPYETEDGRKLNIEVCCIDSGGHHTQEVYGYARERAAMGVIAIKGMNVKGKPPLGKASKVDINFKGRAMKNGAQLFPVGVDGVKSLLFGREMVYAYAALHRLYQKYDRRSIWEQFERRNEPNKASQLGSKQQKRPKRRNFVSSW